MPKFHAYLMLFVTLLLMAFCKTSSNPDKPVTPGWPEITSQTKPWTRWWWLGSSVDSVNLSRLMEEYSRAGLGGLEITPIYGVKGLEDKFITFTSDRWMNMLTYTLSESKRLDLGIDMAMASGWPFGGPWVTPADACKNLELKSYKLEEGQELKEKIEFIQKPFLKTIGKRTTFSNLNDPIATNDSMQYYAFEQVRFPRKLPVVAVMAFSDKGEIKDLTKNVNIEGMLEWKATSGNWTLIAAFAGWHGKMVERAGPGGEGDVIDHFSLKATQDYLGHFDKSFEGYDLSGLRAFFNDSYEVDDASGEANWTPDFFDIFKTKRGYDLKNYLPILVGEDSDEKRRIMCDYRETISDLLLENYTIPWRNWAESKGKIIRNQSHGSPANILDLYAASDIPETEGVDILNIKFASSAAHVSGRKLISAEAATWLNEHFLSNLADAKKNIDRYLVGGVNHIVYHGTPYSPEKEPWPGRLFYASEHFAPTNPLWKDFPALNSYITRVQSFLQRGATNNDILLYFPIFDQWMEPGKSFMPHFHGADPSSAVYKVAGELNDKGYGFDFISDKQMKELNISGTDISTNSGLKYKTVLLPPTAYIPLETLNKIIDLAKQGANIVFLENMPGKVPGFSDYSNAQKQIQQLLESLNFIQNDLDFKVSEIGKGSIKLGKNMEALLKDSGIKREPMVDSGLEYIKMIDGQAVEYFITNWSEKAVEGWIPFNCNGTSAILYNPMNGDFGSAKTKKSADGNQHVYLKLKCGESFIVQFWENKIDIAEYSYWSDKDKALILSDIWNIQFIQGGPVLPVEVKGIALKPWTDLPDENAKNFSGTAIYSTIFPKPSDQAQKWRINLGEVFESASIQLNGVELGTLIGPDYSLEFDATVLKESNVLKISVTNLMANRIIYMDKQGIDYQNFYNVNFAARIKENQGSDGKFTAINWTPLKSGLSGPVILVPLKKISIE